MNDEHDVHDLLTRVVPEEPAVDRMGGLTRRRRVQRAQTAVAAGALAVVTVVAIPLAVGRFTSDDSALDPTFDPRVATEVYAANPCPDDMPAYEDLPRALPDLTRVTAVRYCTSSEQRRFLRMTPADAEVRAAATPDALVTGLQDFAGEIDALAAADKDRCAAFSYLASGDALALELDDGSQVLVTTDFCTGVRRDDGSKIGGQDLANAFWRELDAQRSTFAYAGEPDVPLSCTSPHLSGPVRPTRESLVEAVACPDGTSESPALAVDLEGLDQAWGDAVADTDPDTSVENPCTEPEERPSVLLARTDRGDTIQLLDTPCDFLAFSTRFTGLVHYQVPTTLAALTD